MTNFAGKDRRRKARLNHRLIRAFRTKILVLLPCLALLPFWFLLCRLFGSHTARIVIPLVLATIVFLGILIETVSTGKFTILLGAILIIPIFVSACVAFADFPFFADRIISTRFPSNQSPSFANLLGTDYEGRDILATIIIGGMNAYLVALLATAIALLVGVPTGLGLAVRNRVVRAAASSLTQFFEIVPQLFFVLIVLGVFNFWAAASAGSRLVAFYAVPMAAFAIGFSSLPSIARIVENKVQQLQSRRFVTALQSSNVSRTKILLYNILWKNCITEIVVQATFLFGATILIESALGYAFEIGFGDLGTGGYLSWGKILAESRRSILFGENTWIVAFPILVTIMSILGINIIGDTLVKFMRKEA